MGVTTTDRAVKGNHILELKDICQQHIAFFALLNQISLFPINGQLFARVSFDSKFDVISRLFNLSCVSAIFLRGRLE